MAAAVDPGFDIGVLATMLDSLSRFSDEEIPAVIDSDIGAVRDSSAHGRSSCGSRHGVAGGVS
jgi:hypothetical protein